MVPSSLTCNNVKVQDANIIRTSIKEVYKFTPSMIVSNKEFESLRLGMVFNAKLSGSQL